MAKTPPTDAAKRTKSSVEALRLQRWNFWLAGIFAVVGFAVLLVSVTKTFPVYASYMTPDPVASDITGKVVWSMASRLVFEVNVAQLLAVSCFIIAAGQLLAATMYRRQYEADLKKRQNKVRWISYGLSGGSAIIVVALLAGIAELSVLALLFLLSVLVGILGLILELQSQASRVARSLLYVAAGLAGGVQWLIIAGSFWATTVFGSGAIAGFVYWIFGIMLVMHLILFAYTVRQTKGTGSASDYMLVERRYMLLGTATMLLLVAQVFRGVL